MLIPKSKKTIETILDLRPSFKISIDARVEGLISNMDYLENRHHKFIQKRNLTDQNICLTHFLLWTVSFVFVWRFYTIDGSLSLNKYIRLSSSCLNSFYEFFIFWFEGLSFKTWVLTSGKWNPCLVMTQMIVVTWSIYLMIFFLTEIHSMQGWTATMMHGVTKKEAQKRLQDTENLFRKNLQLKDVC